MNFSMMLVIIWIAEMAKWWNQGRPYSIRLSLWPGDDSVNAIDSIAMQLCHKAGMEFLVADLDVARMEIAVDILGVGLYLDADLAVIAADVGAMIVDDSVIVVMLM